MADPTSVADRFAAVRRRLGAACERARRSVDDVVLLAVSKRQPVARILQAVETGHRIFGESRVQEAEAKCRELPTGLHWHLIGPLQSNKVKRAARLFDVVHSLDRVKIVRVLHREACDTGRSIEGFLQINVGAEGSKSGFTAEAFEDQVRPLLGLHGEVRAGQPGLRFVGLMAIPPFEESAESARRWFRQLRDLRDRVASWPEWAGFRGDLSMGMSHDFEIAIEEGATHVRVGTDLFGHRPE